MELVSQKELSNITHLKGIGGELVAKLLMHLLKFNKLNKEYSKLGVYPGIDFITQALESWEVTYEIDPNDLKKIPVTGPFITISNHPYGGVDGLVLIKVMNEIRPDFKILANFLLQRIEPIKEFFLPVNPFENYKDAKSSVIAIKNALEHVNAGNSIGLFPAGEVSTFQNDTSLIADRRWQHSILKFIVKSGVPILPVYFHGTNSRVFHLLGRIHPLLRTAKLPSELFNKKNKPIKLKIGNLILAKEYEEFNDIDQFGRYLRAKTYSLNKPTAEVKKFFKQIKFQRASKIEDVMPPQPSEKILEEIRNIENYFLYQHCDFKIYCAPSSEIPCLLNEIGRLREITFREVGEGTNRSIDLDEYDIYYHQLIIWHETDQKIVGSYRIGKGKEIIAEYGKTGFYTNSLFGMSDRFIPILNNSLELGRFFIVKEYQKKPLSLFLLWKGIMYYLLKNADYRYLIGPVSISNEFSTLSKSLIVKFIKKHFYNEELAAHVFPKKRFKVDIDKNVDGDFIINNSDDDLNKLDKFIADIESNLKIPVLLKKYISLNAKFIGFNIDPKFNNCLDGLIVVDIFDVPENILKSMSKDLNDDSVLKRFNI